MPSALETPVLQVDANVIHKVDTSNPQNLFSMWTVFARCADSVAQGRRLENLSWRLWTRETFCVDSSRNCTAPAQAAIPKPIPQRSRPSSEDVPQLSGSVESVADDEAVEFATDSAPMDIARPRIRRQDSCASSRSRKERHITSDDLEKMVVSIIQQKESLTAPLPDLAPLAYQELDPIPEAKTTVGPMPVLERSGSTTDESSPSKDSDIQSSNSSQQASPSNSGVPDFTSHTTVVRGFSPSQIAPITRPIMAPLKSSSAEDSIPEPMSSPAPKIIQPKKQPPMFAVGASSDDSLSDEAQSMEQRKPMPQLRKKMFHLGRSEEDSSPRSALRSSHQGSPIEKKQTAFCNELVTDTIPAPPVVEDEPSETEGEYIDESQVDESAIDDDDEDSDWEDSTGDSEKSATVEEQNLFQRVDSTAKLPSRRSLITLMIEKDERDKKLGLTASRSTSAISRAARVPYQPPSLVASPESNEGLTMRRAPRGGAPLRPINEVPRSAAQPIISTAPTGHYQAALSPRTTRRNMLSTELTESLRRHLLWERSQKSSTANAVLKRRHTSHDVANLKQYPEKVHMNKDGDLNAGSWDQYLNRDAFNGYHSKGW